MKAELRGKVYVPDGEGVDEAVRRVTHLAIGAHQDDLEIFAFHGIAECFEREDLWFGGVTVTDGGGSSRIGPYRDYTDGEMKAVRVEEQKEASRIGKYAFQAQLGWSSGEVKGKASRLEVVDEIEMLLRHACPETLYLHNPADKHDTHMATLGCCLSALRRLPVEMYPENIYGCEVWRDLDWVADEAKVALPVDRHPELARRLIEVFDSQVAGGKDYVAATLGRRKANATYYDPHATDAGTAFTFALDLKPLLQRKDLSLEAFMLPYLDDFRSDVLGRIQKYVP